MGKGSACNRQENWEGISFSHLKKKKKTIKVNEWTLAGSAKLNLL